MSAYAEKKLMKHTKKELCEKVIMLGLRCVELEQGLEQFEVEVKEYVKQNEDLQLEAERDSKEYYELLKYKNHIMKKYRDELKSNPNELQEVVLDLGGNSVYQKSIKLVE